MILYAFQGRYGGDKVCWSQQEGFAVGDLLVGGGDMFLVINNSKFGMLNSKGNKELNLPSPNLDGATSFTKEASIDQKLKIQNGKSMITEELTLHYKQFLRKESIELISRMAHEYYTSYKNVVKLFVTGELADLFKKEISVKKKSFFLPFGEGQGIGDKTEVQNLESNAKTNPPSPILEGATSFIKEASIVATTIENSQPGQQLIVFPDVWTMINTLEKKGIRDKAGVAILTSTSTQQQKDKARWGIKMGHVNTIICTYSQIFQDRKDLKSITLIDSHQRYYKNQQDPRYDTREVVKTMAKLYSAELMMTGVQVFL